MTKFSHITKDKIEKAILTHDVLSIEERKTYGAEGRNYAVLYGTNLYPVKRLICIVDNFTHFPSGVADFNATEARKHLLKIGIKVISFSNSELNLNEGGYFDDEVDDKNETLPEGAKKQIFVNAYERNIKARAHCLEKHGYQCSICGFSFGKVYGELFQYKIHVHHIKPLSEIQENYEVDPINDLIPVCPNCHMILHSKGKNEVYSVDEVKSMICQNKS